MRFLLLMICFVVSVTFVSCEDTPKTTAQIEHQAQPKSTNTIVDETVTESPKEEVKFEKMASTTEVASKTKTPSKPKKRPVLSFANKTFDYGMIAQGDIVNHTFEFTNKGNSDLIIKDAKASCGCTTPSYPFIPIKPGETGQISVTFNSTGKMGTHRPNITVTSNAYPRVQTIYLNGFVTDEIAKKEEKPLVEEKVNINPDGNTTKGEEENNDN